MARLIVFLHLPLLFFSLALSTFLTGFTAPLLAYPLDDLPLLERFPQTNTDVFPFCIPRYYDYPHYFTGEYRLPPTPTFNCGVADDRLRTTVRGQYGQVQEIWYSLPTGETFNVNALYARFGEPFRIHTMRGGAFFRWRVKGGVIVAFMGRRSERIGALQILIIPS